MVIRMMAVIINHGDKDDGGDHENTGSVTIMIVIVTKLKIFKHSVPL